VHARPDPLLGRRRGFGLRCCSEGACRLSVWDVARVAAEGQTGGSRRGSSGTSHPTVPPKELRLRDDSPVEDAEAPGSRRAHSRSPGLLSHLVFSRGRPGRTGYADDATSPLPAAVAVRSIALALTGIVTALGVSCGPTCAQAPPAAPDRTPEESLLGVTVSRAPAAAARALAPCALHVAILDVGQADAIVVVSNDGEAMVVDAGHGTTAAQASIEFLSDPAKNGLQTVDEVKAMVVTHYDQDHVGGVDEVIAAVTVARAYGQEPSVKRRGTAGYIAYLQAVGDRNDNVADDDGIEERPFIRRRARPGLHWKIGDAQARILAARGDTRGADRDLNLDPEPADIDENPGSIALLVTLGEFELYTAGDQTSDDWKNEPEVEMSIGSIGRKPRHRRAEGEPSRLGYQHGSRFRGGSGSGSHGHLEQAHQRPQVAEAARHPAARGEQRACPDHWRRPIPGPGITSVSERC
jgi:beta-lactamase superfamily II metal-dependent hydrolase